MRYHNITKDDMLNGDGLRIVVWTAGCDHNCKGCHNPITWDKEGGLVFDNDAKEEVFAELNKDYISGVTFSGGDPLYKNNRDGVINFVKEIKAKYPMKTVWLYTGYTWDEISMIDGIDQVDVLVDGRYEQKLKDLKLHWRGSTNQRVIDVKRTISNGHIIEHKI